MKVSIALLIAGSAIVVGVIAYTVYQSHQKQTDSTMNKKYAPRKNNCDKNIQKDKPEEPMATTTPAPSHFHETKMTTVFTVKDRHRTASEVIEESLNNMKDDSEEHTERIDRINDDLDELLK